MKIQGLNVIAANSSIKSSRFIIPKINKSTNQQKKFIPLMYKNTHLQNEKLLLV
jgi:hypothetical protein